MDSTRHRKRIPVESIRQLVQLAVANNLSSLEIGDVRIVVNPNRPIEPSKELQFIRDLEEKAGRKLTDRELEDAALFGPGAQIRVTDGTN